jgi:hypothetical protein
MNMLLRFKIVFPEYYDIIQLGVCWNLRSVRTVYVRSIIQFIFHVNLNVEYH